LFARGEAPRTALREALALIERTDLRAMIGTIGQDSLVIAGERDALVPPEASRRLAAALPRASFRSIPGAAHVPFLAHPDAFLALMPDGH
jgi:pimeloyl-[acyl-carrier protein] methyl ester esterase